MIFILQIILSPENFVSRLKILYLKLIIACVNFAMKSSVYVAITEKFPILYSLDLSAQSALISLSDSKYLRFGQSHL